MKTNAELVAALDVLTALAHECPDRTGEPATTADPLDPQVGEAVMIRTVTMIYTGRVTATSGSWLQLDRAAWIADTGRFADALARGELNEVEPMGDGVLVGRDTIVDIAPWVHPLPVDQK